MLYCVTSQFVESSLSVSFCIRDAHSCSLPSDPTCSGLMIPRPLNSLIKPASFSASSSFSSSVIEARGLASPSFFGMAPAKGECSYCTHSRHLTLLRSPTCITTLNVSNLYLSPPVLSFSLVLDWMKLFTMHLREKIALPCLVWCVLGTGCYRVEATCITLCRNLLVS